MAEVKEIPIQEDKITEKSEDPRIIDYSGEYFAKLAETFPEFTPEQRAKAMQLSEEFALEKIRIEDSGDSDQLTELPTRKGFYKAFDSRIQQYHRIISDEKNGKKIEDIKAALLYFDLDGFKEVNERYDHQAGDRVLSVVGQLLKAYLRPTDIAVRHGGDEFGAYLDDVTLEQAIDIADRIKISLNFAFNGLFPEYDWLKTLSMGVRRLSDLSLDQLDPQANHQDLAEKYIHEADVAQNKGAKHAGKDRIGVMLDDGQIRTATVLRTPGQAPIIQYQTP